MIPRIKGATAKDDYKLDIYFEDGSHVIYDVQKDIEEIPAFRPLKDMIGLFASFTIDESRTCITWTDEIDLPSDTLKEYGCQIA